MPLGPAVAVYEPSFFPIGSTVVMVTATDVAGNTGAEQLVVWVGGTTAPEIVSLTADKPSLWPPNHQLELVTVKATLSDTGNRSPTFKIVGVSRSEPDHGRGDGRFPRAARRM